LLEREGVLMGAVLAPGQDYRRTGDALMMAVGVGLLERFELVDDRLHVGELVAPARPRLEEIEEKTWKVYGVGSFPK
jgi:hypothetical protein